MVKFGKKVVKFRIPIIIISILLLIPATLGYINTRVNYDVLTYLPEDIETMQGQDILVKDFGTGAFSMFIVDGMEDKDVSALKTKIENVDHVSKVLWYDSLADISMPKSMLPEKLYEVFNSDTGTMMAIFFDEGTSSDGTMEAIGEIRELAGKQCFLSGMSAIVTDTKNLAEKETPVYVLIAVLLAIFVLGITMESFFVPLLFMLSIGMAIVYNLGSNYFLGEISYITKALAAVLQLGVTLDYSIFLMHSYEEQQIRYDGDKERAMAHAISQTFSSVIGSSVTTVAGFIALCFMTFTLGMDIGVVMVKGVIFERNHGADKYNAITTAHRASAQSIMVSALSFFAATIGVGLYSNIDMISSLCILMARGALISMVVVIFVLPSMFMVFDKIIVKTSKGFLPKEG